ncbi:nitroreductase family protein [Ruminococcaceae bacterium OttesenSCG-928-I18]|nr:nitroreductase family protein [Ruminococcaceae bacterium OttesenSCG-928-I18]
MQDFLQLCTRRQSCRNYDGRTVEHEKLEKVMEAARLTPSGCNGQPWSFVVVEDAKVLPEVVKCAQSMDNNPWADKAGAFIIVVEEPAVLMPQVRKLVDSQYFAKGDMGAACYGITLQAEELGLGSCIIGIFDRAKLRELLAIPKESPIFIMIALGYPADDKVREKTRKDLSEIVRYV